MSDIESGPVFIRPLQEPDLDATDSILDLPLEPFSLSPIQRISLVTPTAFAPGGGLIRQLLSARRSMDASSARIL
jgi:hypothetical protein